MREAAVTANEGVEIFTFEGRLGVDPTSPKGRSAHTFIVPGALGAFIVPFLSLPAVGGVNELEYGLKRRGQISQDFTSLGNPRYFCTVVISGEAQEKL
jgi:hypothetical protein